VVQEFMKHQYSPTGPALGVHQGEKLFYTKPPLPFSMAAPEAYGAPAYVLYKMGGDAADCQFFTEPPKDVTPRVSKPHDYANHMFMRL
jgi:hypothetical protein